MKAKLGFNLQPAQISTSSDVLGPILNSQYILHKDKNIQIARDGTLVPSLPPLVPIRTNINLNKPSPLKVLTPNKDMDNDSSGYESSAGKAIGGQKIGLFGESSSRDVNALVRKVPGGSPGSSGATGSAASHNNGTDFSTSSSGSRGKEAWSGSGHSAAEEYNQSFKSALSSMEDPNGSKAYESFLSHRPSLPDESSKPGRDDQDKNESAKRTKNDEEDDAEYNIYSDIEGTVILTDL